MAGVKGNKNSLGKKNAQKLKTPELKKMAYEQYCAHLAAGKAKKSWYFKHPDLIMTWETMEKYIREDSFFDPIHKEVAWAEGYQHWEQVVEDSAKGINKDANTATLQMVMRNKYQWDKERAEEKENTMPLVRKLAEKWRGN